MLPTSLQYSDAIFFDMDPIEVQRDARRPLPQREKWQQKQ